MQSGFVMGSWRYHRFHTNPLTTIYYVVFKFKKALSFIIDSGFLIHMFECTMIAVLRFSMVTTANRTLDFSEVKKVTSCIHKLEHFICLNEI